MSESEQAGVERKAAAGLAAVNREYEARFGFTYIVRAAGRDGAEMVALARERLGHDRRTELVVAAGEQREITGLRLRRLLCLAEEEG
jgi:2-oxo-4-hydroxy-4-carboxy--5-ureidoimidazoline (OHCU) decarboxylase